MGLDEIHDNAADQDKGRLLDLADPFTGTATGVRFFIAGPDSRTARRAQLALADELAEVADRDGRVSAEDRETARLNALAALVVRWEAEQDGEAVTANAANLRRLLSVAWVAEAVDAFAGDRRNFAPEA